MRSMKDSGIEWIGDIPEDWEVMNHKNIMYKKKNICSKYNGENILSLTVNGVIKRDLENPSGKMPATFDGYQKVEKNNLLLCLFDIDVTPRCVGLINDDGLTSPAYSQFVLKNNNNPRFYNYLLQMIDNDKCFIHLSKNLRSSLNENDFGIIKSIVPSVEEQELIADYLDSKVSEIDNIISKTKETIEEYKKYKQSVIKEVVTKGLNPNVEMKDSGIEWIGEIPKDWEVCNLSKHIIFKQGIQISIEEQSDVEENKLRFLRIIDYTQNTEDKRYVSNNYKNYLVSKDDIVVVRYGSTCGFIGYGLDGVLANNLFKLETLNNKKYIYYLLISNISKQQIDGLRNNTAMPSIKFSDFGNIKIPFTSYYKEQEEIAKYLDTKRSEIDKLISKKQDLITELEQYKKSLIYECVTGKKEVSPAYAD